jgi:hypothetical protein
METGIRVKSKNGKSLMEYSLEDWKTLLEYFNECDAMKWELAGIPFGDECFDISRTSFMTSIRQVLNWLELNIETRTQNVETWRRMLGILRGTSVNLSRCGADVIRIELIKNSERNLAGSML